MATSTVVKYLDDDGNPVGADTGVTPPAGYSLLSSKKSAAPKKEVKPVKELKAQAEKLKPVVPPSGYVLRPTATISAYTPSALEQLRDSIANSAVGYSLQQALPTVAKALHLQPSEVIGSPQARQHQDQLLAPEYLAPAVTEAIRTGPLMGAPAPPEGRAPDAMSNRIEGGLRATGGLTTPGNLALMATMGGAAAELGALSPVAANVLGRVASGGFTLQMLKGLYDQHKEYRKAVDAGDINEAQKIQGEMGVNGIMALLTAKHALTRHPFTPVTEPVTRERTNVLHRNTAGEVRQAPGQAPTVWLSPDAWKSFMGSLYPDEAAGETHGINLPADERLHNFANDPQLAAANPAFGEVQKLLAEAHKSAGEGGVAIAKQRPSIQANVNVMREELNHTWQRSLANGNVTNHLKPEAFTNLYHAIPIGMYDHLIEHGYDGSNSPEIVTESAAKLMDGRPERFGVTDDDAVDFLDKYFKSVTDQHGAKALEELHHVRGIAADAKARAIEEHGRTGAGQSNGTVPSVAAGGQGGAAKGVPAAGEVAPAFAREVDPDSQMALFRQMGEKLKEARNNYSGNKPETVAAYNEALRNYEFSSPSFMRKYMREQMGQIQKPGDVADIQELERMSKLGETLFNREKEKPVWYLKSERLIGDKMKGPQPAEDVHKMLLSGGVKPEEMHWTGLDEFLKSKGKEKVTPEEIREHLANNNIQLKEVVKGEGALQVKPSEEYPGEFDVVDKTGRVRFSSLTKDEAEEYREREDKDDTKYGSYVLPGGENYREMLLTMPVNPAAKIYVPKLTFEEFDSLNPQLAKEFDQSLNDHADRRISQEDRDVELNNVLYERSRYVDDDIQKKIREQYRDMAEAHSHNRGALNKYSQNTFRSSHWEEPNILAHVRFNDRTNLTYTPEDVKRIEDKILEAVPSAKDASSLASGAPNAAVRKGLITPEEAAQYSHAKGYRNDTTGAERKLLHVEEIQSDMHQKGRDKGYRKPLTDEDNSTLSHISKEQTEALEIRDRARWDGQRGAIPNEEARRIETEQTRRLVSLDREKSAITAKAQSDLPPDAPFKKTWHEMALRRLLKHAADNGYDGLSWTGGVEQVKRYPDELRKIADQITWTSNPDTGERYVLVSNNTKPVFEGAVGADGKFINSEAKGKRVDEVIGKTMGQRILQESEGNIEGKDFTVGGEGMKGFYDKIVPDYLNKFGKKYGAKVGETEIRNGSTEKAPYSIHYDSNQQYYFLSHDGEVMDDGGSENAEDAQVQADKLNKKVGFDKNKKVQYLPITPEMRKSVSEEGVPLFNREQEKTPEFKQWFGDSKVVDKDGKPLVVYHGTLNDFDEFDPSASRDAEIGTFFATDPKVANHFADPNNPDYADAYQGDMQPNVMPVYLSIKNPITIKHGDMESTNKQIDAARKAGYDGALLLNVPEGKNLRSDQWVAFKPEQIKSAIGNTGAFDPNDPNILRNREKEKYAWLHQGVNKYTQENGLPPITSDPRYLQQDPRAKEIADAYEAMRHNPADPAVAKSYGALKDEIKKQWDFATKKMGVTFEPWDGAPGTQPYENSAEMTEDVKKNHHLYFFQGGDMPADHPLAEVDPKTGLTYNDLLRGVHDLFGHAVESYKFGSRGEENAWRTHSQMFSPEALPALTTETKGQNSWVNAGPQMRDAKGNLLQPGQPGYLEPKDRKFAEQKAGLLPEKFYSRNVQGGTVYATSNTERGLSLEQAVAQSSSPEFKQYIDLAKQIDAALGASTEHQVAVGSYNGVNEPSLVTRIQGTPDIDVVRVAAALRGKLAKQESTLTWFNEDGGRDTAYHFLFHETPQEVLARAKKAGYNNVTAEVIPGGGTLLHILHTDGETPREDINETRDRLGAQHGLASAGHGTLIPARVYDKIIDGFGKRSVGSRIIGNALGDNNLPSSSREVKGGQEELQKSPEPLEEEVSLPSASKTISIQGGTVLASAPVQDRPAEKVHTSAPHQTTATVSVPLQTAIPNVSVATKRVLPLRQVMIMAAGLNPNPQHHQVKSARELMKLAKERIGNQIIP